jgi:mono/diheme cytochrome c family protein
MNKYAIQRVLVTFAMVGLLWLTGARSAHAQFTQNRETVRIDSASYPAAVKKSYGVFAVKCGECHTLDRSLKPRLPSAAWTSEVKRMQAMASAHITEQDVRSILNFLNYDESHRKAQLKSGQEQVPMTPMMPMASAMMGKQFYSAQGCDSCHSIAGKGGDVGPALNDVGTKLSRDQIAEVIKNGKPNTAMPALAPGATDEQIKQLVDYLANLK